jgi:hypothetical protein
MGAGRLGTAALSLGKGLAGKVGVGGLISGGFGAMMLPGMLSSGFDLSDTVLGTDMLGKKRDARSLANSALADMLRENDELSLMEGKEFLNSSRMNEMGPSIQTPLYNSGAGGSAEMAGLQEMLMREQSRLGMASMRQSQQPDLYELAQRIGMSI